VRAAIGEPVDLVGLIDAQTLERGRHSVDILTSLRIGNEMISSKGERKR